MYSIPHDPQLEAKEAEYRAYLEAHIHNVHEAYKAYGTTLIEQMNQLDPEHPVDIHKLSAAIRAHDVKKFDPEEFDGYRLMYFPTDQELDKYTDSYRQVCYSKSFNLHSHESNHHLEFWSYIENMKIVCIEMSNEAIIEMLLDWQTKSGRAFIRPADYWESVRTQKAVARETRSKIGKLIRLLPGAGT